MGIRSFETFLKIYPVPLLQTVEVHHEYLVIDGSELIYELTRDIQSYGRANYIEYREKLVKFFGNLQECGIKPIVIFDGFKYEDNTEIFLRRRVDKIGKMTDVAHKRNPNNQLLKGLMCNMIFKQIANDLNIPWSVARRNTDQDIAAVASFLKAPVLASDTGFSAYALEAGYLPFRKFEWKNMITSKDGITAIKAEKFQIDEFANRFGVDREAVAFLAVIFNNRPDFDLTRFKNNYFRNIAIPTHLRSIQGPNYRRPFMIENSLIWFSKNRDKSAEDIIRLVSRRLSRHDDVDMFQQQARRHLEAYRNPKVKSDLLQELIDKLNDPDAEEKLANGIEAEDEDATEIVEYQSRRRAYAGNFPYWGLQVFVNPKPSHVLCSYLPLVLTDPNHYVSPHNSSRSIRMKCYEMLLCGVPRGEMVVQEFDRVNLAYEEVDNFRVQRPLDDLGIFSTRDQPDQIQIGKRKSILLQALIEEEGPLQSYNDVLDSLDDDMKLTLAVTIYWKAEVVPDNAAVKALAFLFALMQVKHSNEALRSGVEYLLNNIARNVFGLEVNLGILQLTSQWEVCMNEAVNLNQILRFPLPEPKIGRFFSGSVLEMIYAIITTGEGIEVSLRRMKEVEDLFHKFVNIISA